MIDAPTWEALGEDQRAGFVAYEQTFVRGRSTALDVHALPLRRA